jgi:hypothetical protein
MSLATHRASCWADREIIKTVVDLSVGLFRKQLRSIVLTGSLARGEGTWIQAGRQTQLAGDAEFLLVFNDIKFVPKSEVIQRLRANVEAELAQQHIEAEIDLSPVEPRFLCCQRPHIFAYELVAHGKVVWGDTQILNLVPSFKPTDIPLEDGYRTLMNRMIELLEVICDLDGSEPNRYIVSYRAMKLSLDMATSFSLFKRIYEPSYRARAHRIGELSAGSTVCPSFLSRLSYRVQIATKQKLGEQQLETIGRAGLSDLISDLHLLWRWELEQLVRTEFEVSDGGLVARWSREEQALKRIRGWASLIRRYGISSSLVNLPRWAFSALVGSPRRLLYAAASELIFAMPEILNSRDDGVNPSRWDNIRKHLPVKDGVNSEASAAAWRRLAGAIAWNYHTFLKPTRT